MSEDPFGIPDNMFGPVEDEFYGALGRFLMLSSLLESRLLDLLQSLAKKPQSEFVNKTAPQLVDAAKDLVSTAEWPAGYGDSDANRCRIGEFLEAVAGLFPRGSAMATAPVRNDYAHNLWSVRGAGRYFGWRRGRDGSYVNVETSLDQLREDIARLVALNATWPAVYALLSPGSHTISERTA